MAKASEIKITHRFSQRSVRSRATINSVQSVQSRTIWQHHEIVCESICVATNGVTDSVFSFKIVPTNLRRKEKKLGQNSETKRFAKN